MTMGILQPLDFNYNFEDNKRKFLIFFFPLPASEFTLKQPSCCSTGRQQERVTDAEGKGGKDGVARDGVGGALRASSPRS